MNQTKLFSRVKYAVIFLLLMLLDISPVPVTALIGLYVIIFRPRWFREMIESIY